MSHSETITRRKAKALGWEPDELIKATATERLECPFRLEYEHEIKFADYGELLSAANVQDEYEGCIVLYNSGVGTEFVVGPPVMR